MAHFDALITAQHFDAPTWNSGLAQVGYPNPGTRGALLHSVSRGIEEIWKRHATPTAGTRPPLTVPVKPLEGDWEEREGKLFYSVANKIVVATRTWLDTMSALPIDRDVDLQGHENQLWHRGKLLDLCILMGSEEADHALFRKEGLITNERSFSDTKQTLADYDAMPIEFRALERQLEIAISLSMPIVTINLLQQRVENARRIMQVMK